MTGGPTRTIQTSKLSASLPLAVVLRGPKGKATPPELHLSEGRATIGSAPECDLVLKDQAVSRRHAEVELRPEGVQVKDLGSRNGTHIMGQRIHDAVLGLGTRFVVGNSEIQIVADTIALEAGVENEGESFRGLVGTSRSIRRLFTTLSRLDGSLVPVLIHGESGVGKELVARAIHEGSLVGSGPFVPVNCGAIPRELVASTLFGHTKGAFTGAAAARKGAFMAADGGTLFLDEIGELPLEVQPMLLRALESSEVQVVGEDTPRKVRARIVAATNRDLRKSIAARKFREDLYYRLAVVAIDVPPLRDRLDDVSILASHFARQEGLAGLPDDVLAHLATLPWTGNIRELRNAVQAYAALGVVPEVGRRHASVVDAALAEFLQDDAPYADQKEQLCDRFTRLYLDAVLRRAGNQKEAAKIAGLDRTYFGRLIAKHGLKTDDSE